MSEITGWPDAVSLALFDVEFAESSGVVVPYAMNEGRRALIERRGSGVFAWTGGRTAGAEVGQQLGTPAVESLGQAGDLGHVELGGPLEEVLEREAGGEDVRATRCLAATPG